MTFVGFQGHTYVRELIGTESLVLDLGANEGRFASEIQSAFDCQVVCVEANPLLAARLPQTSRITAHNFAICGETGTRDFNVGSNSEASSLQKLGGFDYVDSIKVPTITLPLLLTIINTKRVQVLKCDMEGSELEMFAACPDEVIRRCDQINIEFHAWAGLGTTTQVQVLKQRIRSLGFRMFNFNSATDMDVLFVRQKLIPAWSMRMTSIHLWIQNSWRKIRLRRNHVS